MSQQVLAIKKYLRDDFRNGSMTNGDQRFMNAKQILMLVGDFVEDYARKTSSHA